MPGKIATRQRQQLPCDINACVNDVRVIGEKLSRQCASAGTEFDDVRTALGA
jgi:hypothetical protein